MIDLGDIDRRNHSWVWGMKTPACFLTMTHCVMRFLRAAASGGRGRMAHAAWARPMMIC